MVFVMAFKVFWHDHHGDHTEKSCRQNKEERMMTFPKILLAAAASMMIAGMSYAPAPVQAQDVNIFVDIPGFGRLPGYEYGGRRYISCRHGARIVDRRGYNRVQPFDCSRPNYRYRARRGGIWWIVRLNARTGNIVGARPL